MKKIGLLGGSFDPPHRGHIFISLEAKKIFALDEIWWLLTPKNPLKISNPATYYERLANCNNIVKNQPIIIKEIEKKINSKYSYYTLKHLLNHYKNIKFYWLMGADNLIFFHRWQNWKKIFNEVSIVVFKRHGYNRSALSCKASKYFTNFKVKENEFKNFNFSKLPSWIILNNKEIKISSTEIRRQREKLRR